MPQVNCCQGGQQGLQLRWLEPGGIEEVQFGGTDQDSRGGPRRKGGMASLFPFPAYAHTAAHTHCVKEATAASHTAWRKGCCVGLPSACANA